MCDKIIKRNLPEEEHPKYVYKRVQKVRESEYISPVMGEPMAVNKWLKAPTRDLKVLAKKSGRYEGTDLVDLIRRKWKKKSYTNSSGFTEHHNGMWGSFKNENCALKADLISNFLDTKTHKPFPTVVVKCEVKGIVHKTQFACRDTFLTTHIKIVEEIGEVLY